MSRASFALSALAIGLFIAGCGSQPGRSTVTYYKGKTPPPLASVERPGHYAVYPSDGTNPIWSGHLDRGDEYGFQTMEDGKTYAVAKGKTIPLQAKLATNYVWKWQGPDEPGMNANGQPIPGYRAGDDNQQPQNAGYNSSPSTQPMR
jgi:hypothetical protein